MARKKMLWQLYPSYLVIIILAIIALAWYAVWSQKKFYLEQTASNLDIRAQIIEKQIAELVLSEDYRAVDSLCKEIGAIINTRYTVILPDGLVVGDTEEDPALMENHGARPEISEALKGKPGLSTRFSKTLQMKLMYRALPLLGGSRQLGVIRTSIPITFIDDALSDIRTMDRVVQASVEQPRFLMYLMSSFAFLALLLAAIGIYGLLSYAVSLSRRDFSVRIALGARPGHLVWQVVRRGLLLSIMGAVLGITGAILGSRLISAMLYGTSPTDSLTLIGVTGVVMAIALLASLIPALRASLLDPVAGLRAE